MDESGHSKDSVCNFVGMGGIVASEEDWSRFDTRWKDALDEFTGGHPFHMKDFVRVPCQGVYGGWNETRRRAFLSKLVNAILGSNVRFVGCVVSVRDFEGLLPEHRQMFADPYYMAFQTVTRGMSIIANGAHMLSGQASDPSSVDLIYAYQNSFGATEGGRAQQLWCAIKENTNFGQWMGSYSTGFPKNLYRLQAADLFAYELTQEFEHFFEVPQRKMRWAMKQFMLSMDTSFLIKFYTLPVIIQTLVENNHLTGTDEEKVALEATADNFHRMVRDTLYLRAREPSRSKVTGAL